MENSNFSNTIYLPKIPTQCMYGTMTTKAFERRYESNFNNNIKIEMNFFVYGAIIVIGITIFNKEKLLLI